jgi:light-regulated signal transduction histidine kinase (bacteriophytochrome)
MVPMPVSAAVLQECASEPIHLLGRTQRFGVLLAFDQAGRIAAASGNAPAWCGRSAESLLGSPVGSVLPRQSVQAAIAHARVAAVRGQAQHLHRVGWPGLAAAVDVSVHDSDGLVVIEAEDSGDEPPEAALAIEHCTRDLAGLRDVGALARSATTAVARITGYDRVMVYRFAADGSGTVLAEHRAPGQPSYLGLRYPAADIPPQARRLYLRNPSRVIADAGDEGAPLVTAGGRALDLSLATLRSVSPVHLEYLRNMGTAASMSISLIVDGQLWGLIACHHRKAFRPTLACRAMSELLGRLYSLALARAERQPLEQDIRELLLTPPGMDPLLAAAQDADGHRAACASLARLMGLTGVTTRVDGRVDSWGQALPADQVARLAAALADTPDAPVTAIESLGEQLPQLRQQSPQVAGLLALPLGGLGRDWILLQRDEVRRHVRWAGNPDKALVRRPDGRLSPRGSFAAWRAAVRGHCEPWTLADIELAKVLRTRLLELMAARIEHRAIESAERAAHQQALLVGELNHRVRNMLGLIQGLVQQTASNARSVEDLTQRLHDRVHTLSRAYSQIERAQWQPSALRELLQDEANAFAEPGQVLLEGPEVLLEPQAYLSFAMVVHELATNARKYGALSVAQGRLTVRWHIGETGELAIDWRERGGPAVTAPARAGFGTRVILQGLEHQLNGHASLDFEADGLHARLWTPRGFLAHAAGIREAGRTGRAAAQAAAPRPFAPPAVALVVEDDLVIALLAESMLLQLGCGRVLTAGTAADALRLLDAEGVGLALLDVNLGDHTSERVAQRLAERGVPFVVTTGYSDTDAVPDALRDHRRLCKPYAQTDLAEAVAAAQAA